jgi:cell division protein FtsL
MPSINDRKIRQREEDPDPREGMHRMPRDSVFYEKVFPVLLIVLGVITAIIIVFAAGILLRIIPFQ